ncbi:MAG: hypothetical protein IJQ76_08735 [Prevotella sp.]|nr:hypothetical protein [Prevotella sp.]
MDKWLFIEVQTYQSVNKMGLELGRYVEKRYDHAVVHIDCIDAISADIETKMAELEKKFPRSRPFKYAKREYRDRYQEIVPELSAKPDSTNIDSYIFVLRTSGIRKMNLETSLNF